MGKVHYEFPVKCVHGKIAGNDKVSFAKRQDTGTTYAVKRDDWTMKYTTSEKEQAAKQRQAKFKAVSQSTAERIADPTKRAADEATFKLQTKYKTFRGYVFHLEWEAFV